MNSYLSLYPLVDDEHVKESLARPLMQALRNASPYSPVAGFFRGLAKRRGAGIRGRLDSARLGASEARVARESKRLARVRGESAKNLQRAEALSGAAQKERQALAGLFSKRKPKVETPPKVEAPPKAAPKAAPKKQKVETPPKAAPKKQKVETPPKTAPKKQKVEEPKPTAVQEFLSASKRVAKENPLATAGGLGLAGLGAGYAIGDSSDDRRRMVIL